ncbi:MAG TPA: DEAD/DEAH box helicase [Acidimicrobiia bacterium]|nr:DEAD/DEAH box helicase [Acidimicrobiia bacterium]
MTAFADLGVPQRLVSVLSKQGITHPFPIQQAAIGDLMAGRDVLGRAPTGSGKTLAFGLPLVAQVGKAAPRKPRALVLAPTRELAEQISLQLRPLAKELGRFVFAIYGGVGYDLQRRQLNRGVDLVVATPGRLADLIGEGTMSLEHIEQVVVDEADRMADMGFMPQVRRLLDQTPARRQTALFSATLDGDVAELTRRYQVEPVLHEVGAVDGHPETAHYFWQVPLGERLELTAEIIRSTSPSLIFTRTRHGADRLVRQLRVTRVDAEAIHGGRSQGQRTRALQAFSSGRVEALVATDVAARGIHVDGVACVVHYDLASDPKDYLHRSGRTARAGTGGVVVSLVGVEQIGELRRLQRALGFHDALHDPDNGWLRPQGGSRIGERPSFKSSDQPHSASRRRRPGRRTRRR